jgi:hypothetical protein
MEAVCLAMSFGLSPLITRQIEAKRRHRGGFDFDQLLGNGAVTELIAENIIAGSVALKANPARRVAEP